MPYLGDGSWVDFLTGGDLIQPDQQALSSQPDIPEYGASASGTGRNREQYTAAVTAAAAAELEGNISVNEGELQNISGRGRNREFVSKYKTNSREVEIIGVQSPVTSRFVTDTGTDTGLTIQLLDITSWSEGVEFLYRNLSGATRQIFSHTLRGKLVTRHSGTEGYLNDESLDFEDIAENGEQTLQIGNNFIFNPTQVDQLAEYHARSNFDYRHMYSCTFVGTHDWIEPGTWYTLAVGDATEEDINSVVEALSVTIERGTQGIGSTTVTFKEVLENWKPEWPTGTKFFSSGPAQRTFARGNTLRISSAQDNETAHYYCDGTADDVQIQAAIDRLAASGGGTIFLSGGTFKTTSTIVMKSNIGLIGSGAGMTIIEKNVNGEAIEAIGASGSELTGIHMSSFTVTRNASDTNINSLILYDYCRDSSISEIEVLQGYYIGIYVLNSERINVNECSVINCTIGAAVIGSLVVEDSTSFIITNCIVNENTNTGIEIKSNTRFSSGVISSNTVNDNDFGGIYITGGSIDTIISNNQVNGNLSSGISVSESYRYQVTGNTVTGNGQGIAIGASKRGAISNNIVSNSRNVIGYGLRLTTVSGVSSDDNTISGNTVIANDPRGIVINTSGESNNIVTGNRSTLNGGIPDNATFTNGDATVTNADTTGFTVGDPVVLDGEQIGTVGSITSGVEFELSVAFTGVTGSYDYRVLDDITADNYTDNGTNTTATGNDTT